MMQGSEQGKISGPKFCSYQCTKEKENPNKSGFYVPCCSGLVDKEVGLFKRHQCVPPTMMQANVAHETAAVHSNSVCQPEPNSLHATLQSTGGSMTCDMWQKVADKLVGFVADKGCDWMAKLGCGAEASVVAIGGCQVLGIGPADPLSDVCSAAAESAVIWGCSELCNLPVKDATSKLLHKLDGGCGNAQVKMAASVPYSKTTNANDVQEPQVKMTASMPHPVDNHSTNKTSSHQGAAPTAPAPRDSKKKCGHMFFKSCSNDGDCCSSHGWTCGKDKKCVWHHASLNELLSCDWLTKLTTNVAHLLGSKVCVVGSKFCGSDEQSKLAHLACKDIGLHDANPLAKLCQGAANSALGKACSHFPQMCQGGISESANWLLAHVSPQCQSKGYKCTA